MSVNDNIVYNYIENIINGGPVYKNPVWLVSMLISGIVIYYSIKVSKRR